MEVAFFSRGRRSVAGVVGLPASRPFCIARLPLVLGVAYAVCASVLAAVAVAASQSGRSVAYFTREPVTALVEGGCAGAACSYVGVVSNLGVIAWIACAAGCLLVAYVARADGRFGLAPGAFLYAGALTTALALDDMFLLHDGLFNALSPRTEILIYGAYAVAAGFLVWRFRAFLRRTSVGVLLLAGTLLAVSMLFDRYTHGLHLVEDGAKLIGIVTWAVYFLGTGLSVLRGPDFRLQA